MQSKKFTNLRDIKLAEWLRLVHHKVTLNRDLWDSQSLADWLRITVRGFECVKCKQEAIIINKNNYECFWKDHAANIDRLDDCFISSEDLLQTSLNKLWKIERIIALVQERECYFNSNDIRARLTEDDETKLNRLRKKFTGKVNDFSFGIKESSKRK